MHSSVALSEELAHHAVEVAPRVWWVGAVLPDDPFQCHSYLVEAGSHSVLIDPGSSLTIAATLRKVREVVHVDDIESIVLHHSDPDIADALHVLSDVVTRPDVRVVTEWRAGLLLKHFAARFPMVTIEDLDWRLDLGDGRQLESSSPRTCTSRVPSSRSTRPRPACSAPTCSVASTAATGSGPSRSPTSRTCGSSTSTTCPAVRS